MFGYIGPDSPWLFKKDEILYKASYCGICKSIGRGCGTRARTALTYDMAFVSALVHNIMGIDVNIERERCAVHWLKRRPVAKPDEISVALGCANTILAYHKFLDDKEDGQRLKGSLRHLYKRGYKRATKQHPELEKIIAGQTASQSEIEKRESGIIDEAAEPTAIMMRELSKYILKEHSTPHTEELFYNIGKWVYLVDALDDYDRDVKKSRYNVLFNAYGADCRQKAIKEHGEEIKFIFDILFAGMRESLANIKFHFNHDLTDNIILRGIPQRTRGIFYGKCEKNCKESN